ncbi:uncharacterized protein BX663DRAFT_285783 [Cokeromyces recurvatus]|uniref:uncharacterized protein n=1 Tax=Cokeromyces recurvatus TaxID=90255 RepID=UPI00221EED29|nr:uncharacterized protein BX663DRAFT_285783 [Cokeromyces recurvatus]KAI7905539.1 hypothetical protein BX663DRAFT_285783 [Cokeromyces recurvatus]
MPFNSSQNISLEDRLLQLEAIKKDDLPEFPDDQPDLPSDYEYVPNEEEEEEEEIIEMDESELLRTLEQQESALSIAQRLFYNELNTTESQKKDHEWNLKYLTSKAVEELYAKGWTEVKGFMDLSILKGAHEEADRLKDQNKFISAKDYKSDHDDPYRDMNARDDAILWLDPRNNCCTNKDGLGVEKIPIHFRKILEFVQDALVQDLKNMIRLNNKIEYQLSYFHPNGAHYERHRDAFPIDDPNDTEQRRISVIMYLNPNWSTGDGGEVKIFSRPDEHGLLEVADRTMKPLLGNMLIFLSGVIDYEILATKKPAYILTTWIK